MQYRGLHNWVERHLGKPKFCSECKLDDKDKIYHWANISQEYKQDLSDWKRLCPPCHAQYDAQFRPTYKACSKGHLYTKSNTRMRTARGWRERICRKCQKQYVKNYRKGITV